MASILERYGIKEVADVTFYDIKPNGDRGNPVLYLDTLKVSTIEQTAETADARGGKGNPKLISWDYGKEINVSIEDALFSSKSMAIMFGNGTVDYAAAAKDITKTVVLNIDSTTGKLPSSFVTEVLDSTTGKPKRKKVIMDGTPSGTEEVAFANSGITLISLVSESGAEIDSSLTAAEWTTARDDYKGQKAFLTFSIKALTKTITISGDSFPGTYYITGDTYARSDTTGADQFFQFIIPKAKVTSENTITLEAEGDPSVFNMNLTVLRPESGEMMKLVQYDLTAG